ARGARLSSLCGPPLRSGLHTPPLHDALPISMLPALRITSVWALASTVCPPRRTWAPQHTRPPSACRSICRPTTWAWDHRVKLGRSEEHTSELQSRENLVCRLLLEKKKKSPPV